MMFEDTPQPFVQEAILQNTPSVTAQIMNFGADSSFILNSLQRMKISAVCEIRKKLIDGFIAEYLSGTFGFINAGLDLHSENQTISERESKQSYHKVIREQEFLDKVMNSLNAD